MELVVGRAGEREIGEVGGRQGRGERGDVAVINTRAAGVKER